MKFGNMSNLDRFKKFAKHSNQKEIDYHGKAVIYTRVSTKEQADNNASLETQLKHCKEYAQKKGLEVAEFFGGTYESAKSDERKEFQKMLSFVKRRKDISFIIVYSYDRFSRTGANGAYISDQLKTQGIITLSSTQEVDATTAAGSFQQNLYYMFSQFDNELRKNKTVSGIKEKLLKGYWMGSLPFGYTNLNPGKGKEQKIVVNEQGKILKEAFTLKAKEELTLKEIEEKLRRKGLKIAHWKKLSDYLRNPFYCGLIVSSHLPGQIIEGKHEPLISKELFLKIQSIHEKRSSGDRRPFKDEQLPLKGFVRSSECGTKYTGYLVRAKGLYYYKNNRRGSKENKSAKKMHELFEKLLKQFEISDPKYLKVIQDKMEEVFHKILSDKIEEAKLTEKYLKDFDNKLERLEERFVFEEITSAQYNKFKSKIENEKQRTIDNSYDENINLSNLKKAIKISTKKSIELSDKWTYGDYYQKLRIQNILFPEGIEYNFKNNTYRTKRINSIFSVIPSLSKEYEQKKNGTNSNKLNLSHLVAGAGLEPTTFGL